MLRSCPALRGLACILNPGLESGMEQALAVGLRFVLSD